MKINEGIEVKLGINTTAALASVQQVESKMQSTFAKAHKLNLDTNTLDKAKASLSGIETQGKMSFASLAAAGTAAFGAITAAAYKLNSAVQQYLQFDREMGMVSTLVDYTGAEMTELGERAKQIARETGTSVVEIAKGLYGTITAGMQQEFGYTQAQIASTTKQITELASIQGASVADTTRAVMGLVNLYGKELGPTVEAQVKKVSDVLFQTTKAGITTIQELATSIGFLAPIWKQAGLPIEEMGAGIAALTKKGLNSATSITALKATVVEIMNPSKEAAARAEELGLDFSAAGLKAKGYADFMDDVMVKTKGTTENLTILFNNVRSLVEVLGKASMGTKEFGDVLEQVYNNAGVVDAGLKDVRATAEFQNRQLGVEWEALWHDMGEATSGAFLGMKRGVIDFANEVRQAAADIRNFFYVSDEFKQSAIDFLDPTSGIRKMASQQKQAPKHKTSNLSDAPKVSAQSVTEVGAMTATYLDGTVEKIDAAGKKVETMLAETDKNQKAAIREAQFQKEQAERAHLSRMSDYIDSNFKRRLNALKANLSDEQKVIEAAQKVREGYERRKEASEVSFEEKKNQIASSGLSATGKDIQSRGMADMYGQRQAAAVKRNDFATALQYANKVQDIFATLASDQNNPLKSADFEAFLESQGQIEKIMAQEQKANDAAMKNAQEKVKALTGDLSTLFLNLQKELTIDVSTVAATEQIAELRKSFVELRKDFAGFLPGGSDFQYEKNPEIELFKTKPAEEKKVEKTSEKTAQDKTNNTLTSILTEIRKMMDSEREAVVASRKKGFAQDTNGNFIRETVTTMAAGG